VIRSIDGKFGEFRTRVVENRQIFLLSGDFSMVAIAARLG
jgi:hypothetical protein